eukprot:Em0019g341a
MVVVNHQNLDGDGAILLLCTHAGGGGGAGHAEGGGAGHAGGGGVWRWWWWQAMLKVVVQAILEVVVQAMLEVVQAILEVVVVQAMLEVVVQAMLEVVVQAMLEVVQAILEVVVVQAMLEVVVPAMLEVVVQAILEVVVQAIMEVVVQAMLKVVVQAMLEVVVQAMLERPLLEGGGAAILEWVVVKAISAGHSGGGGGGAGHAGGVVPAIMEVGAGHWEGGGAGTYGVGGLQAIRAGHSGVVVRHSGRGGAEAILEVVVQVHSGGGGQAILEAILEVVVQAILEVVVVVVQAMLEVVVVVVQAMLEVVVQAMLEVVVVVVQAMLEVVVPAMLKVVVDTTSPLLLKAPPRIRSSSSSSVPGSLAGATVGNLGNNLKAFLRSSNLSGLEYRLRIAGFYTMEDLLKTNEEKLKASGLTPLMTSRLIAALSDYHRNKPAKLGPHPSVVRHVTNQTGANVGQKRPEERLAVRKQNVRRTHSQGVSPNDAQAPATRRSAAQVKLLSPADVPDAHLIARDDASDRPDGAATALAKAVSNEDSDEAAHELKLMCQMYSQQPQLKPTSNDLELVVKTLQLWYEDVQIAERGCQLIKQLTRGVDTIPCGAMLAVLDAMCSHPNEVKVQLQAYLAAANIGRTVPHQCKAIVFRGGISAAVAGMDRFYDNSSIQIAGLSLLSVAFAGEPEGRLKYLTDHVRSIDQVVTTMRWYGQDIQVMESSCAFFALLLVGVCHQMECALLLLLVEKVLQSMSAFPQNEALQVWGCKVISHVTTSDLLSDATLATRCVQAVVDALGRHTCTPAVQTWGAYTLYQIMCSCTQSASIVTVGHRDLILELCRRRVTGLTEEANLYLSSLQTVLEV